MRPWRISLAHSTLLVKIGDWFEARATGWGVVALAIIISLAIAAEVARAVA